MELGKLKPVFYNWAKQRHPFNYNKSTKRLTCHGKHFEDLSEPMQHSAIIEFLDQIGICICFAPMNSLQSWCIVILTNDIPSKLTVLYEHKETDINLNCRFEATKFGINKYLEILNA